MTAADDLARIESSLNQQLETHEQQGARCVWLGRSLRIVGSGAVLSTSVALRVIYPPTVTSHHLVMRAMYMLPSYGIGGGLAGVLGAILPSQAMGELTLQTIGVGLVAYLPVTEIYLNQNGTLDRESEFEALQVLAGFLVTALVIKTVQRSRFSALIELQQEHSRLLEPQLANRRFQLFGEGSRAWQVARSSVYIVAGSLLIASSFMTSSDHPLNTILMGFGIYYIVQGLATPAWRFVQERAVAADTAYTRQRRTDPHLQMPRIVRVWRISERALPLITPLTTAALVAFPRAETLGVAGLLQVIEEELSRREFTHPRIAEVSGIARRSVLSSCAPRVLCITYRIVKLVSFSGFLAWFGYEAISDRVPADTLMVSLFLGSWVAGYVGTALADHRFRPETQSRVMTYLFYRLVRVPRLFGVDPIYFYAAVENSGMRIGNGALSHLNAVDLTVVSTAWVTYGFRLGQDMARFDSHRDEPFPIRNSSWLMYGFIIDALERLRNEVI